MRKGGVGAGKVTIFLSSTYIAILRWLDILKWAKTVPQKDASVFSGRNLGV